MPAPAPLAVRFRAVVAELKLLDKDLAAANEPSLANAIKRARRELETVERQGLFQARGI